MQEFKIFLASSEELKSDREQFEIFISRQNSTFRKNKVGIVFELIIWENFFDAISTTRLQDEYNKKIVECDIFVSLFKTKVGKYTEEEFDKALKIFKQTGKPFIYTYFKNATINVNSNQRKEMQSLWNFQDKLSDLGHFYTAYDGISDLKHHFRNQIDIFLPILTEDKPQEKEIFDKGLIPPPSPKNLILEVNAFDIEMTYVKGGKFRMGTEDWKHTQPTRQRRIADFYIGKYPVTTDEYMDFVREMKTNHPEWAEKDSDYNLKTGSDKHYKGFTENPSQPIVGVSWHDARAGYPRKVGHFLALVCVLTNKYCNKYCLFVRTQTKARGYKNALIMEY